MILPVAKGDFSKFELLQSPSIDKSSNEGEQIFLGLSEPFQIPSDGLAPLSRHSKKTTTCLNVFGLCLSSRRASKRVKDIQPSSALASSCAS